MWISLIKNYIKNYNKHRIDYIINIYSLSLSALEIALATIKFICIQDCVWIEFY